MKKLFGKDKRIKRVAAKLAAATLFAGLFTSLAFLSCDNSSSDNTAILLEMSQQKAAQEAKSKKQPKKPVVTVNEQGKKVITFTGSLNSSDGAFPAQMSALAEFSAQVQEDFGVSKSARPSLDTSSTGDYEWFATAKSGSDTVDGEFGTTAATRRVFTMSLEVGKSWNVVCGIRKKGSDQAALSDSFVFEASEDNPVFSHIFTPVPTGGGSGDVALKINVVDRISRVTARCVDPDGAETETELTVAGSSGSKTATLSLDGVASGLYDITLTFFEGNATNGWVYLYSVSQGVNVFNGSVTDTWQAGGMGKIETGADGKTALVVDESEIASYAPTVLYVGDTSGAGAAGAKEPSDSNSGNAYEPLKTIGRAVKIMESTVASSPSAKLRDYKIFVSGTVTSSKASENANFSSALNSKAKSITICGLGSEDTLDAGSKGTALIVATTVPITIRNLKITNGGGATNGGGISMSSGSDLTLDSGALVTQNSATQQGGGVYNRDGSLKIKKGAAISGNWITSAGSSGSDGGAGLFMYGSSASCVMTGGEISDNNKNSSYNSKYVRGGGVRLGGSARMTLSGGSVSGNFSKNLGGNFYIENAFLDISGDAKICQGRVDTSSNTSDDNAWGGALYVDGNSKITMTGGEISGNTAKAKSSQFACAGVYLLKEFEMTGGVIEGNVVEGGLSSGGAFRVGGLLTIGGSAKIPYGGGEGKNDVYVCKDDGAYKVVQVAASGFSYAASDSAPAAVLAPQEWQRNYAIIKAPSGSNIGAYTPYFKTIDPDFSFGKLTDDTAKLKAALCVSNKPSGVDPDDPTGAVDSNDRSGTRSQPYRTIAFALTKLSAGEPDEIIIDYDSNGDVFGPQEIPDTFTTENCSALTIRGANGLDAYGTPKDILNASGTRNAGSVLTVKSAVPITIKDLKITGGNCTDAPGDRSGGGIYLTAGELTLADGVLVVGNYAAYGGGVYVKEGASLFMNGTSYIGDKTQTTASGETLGEQCSNSASYGGGIYNRGKVYLGYKKEGSAIKEADWTGGVRRNYTSANGGGIHCVLNGDLKMRAGTVSYNRSDNLYGGGLCASSSEGHGIELLGGELKENYAGLGGAVYVDGAFSMQGALSIPFGVAGAKSSGKNDIFLTDGKTVEVAGALSLPDGEATVATLTPNVSKRKRKILSASSEDLINGNKDKFALVSDNDGWQKNYVSDSGHYAELNSPVYVVGTQSSGSIKPDNTWGWGKPSYNAPNGTKTSPYANVADALGCAELAVATEPNTITVAGTLKGVQTISRTVTIKGYDSSSAIDGNSAGSALTVDASGKYVTITNLAITGGSAENGGGVNIAAGTVKLGDGAKIYGNKATANGGGVYLAGSDSTLFMFGAAIIGEDKTGYPNDADHASNSAENGGGIYNNGGNLYLGYTGMSGSNPVPASDAFTGGVRRNYAKSYGGIQCEKGINKIRDGNISNNAAQQKGGALGFTNTDGTYSIMGGTFATNYAPSGGAIYVPDATSLVSVTISAGTFDSNVANNGGALWLSSKGKVTVSGSTLFKGNTAGTKGGAVYNEGVFEMTGGTIGGSGVQNKATTTTALGGAIYQNGTFYVSGNALVYAGSERVNDVYLAAASTDVKKISINAEYKGNGNTTTNKMSVTPANWKRGMAILGGSKLTDGSAGNCNYFAVTDSEWSVLSDSTNKGKIDADFWVSEYAISGVTGAVAGDDTNGRGTKAKPYATIQKAASQTWKTGEATINVSGTLTATGETSGKGSLQNIPASGVTATSINLAGTSSATINANSQGSALTVDASGKTVTITNLKITGGTGTADGSNKLGGGIYLKAGTVKLADNAKVYGNKATNGGGVYLDSSSATLYMTGKSLIGYDATTEGQPSNATLGTSSGKAANSATDGGGIYSNGGNVYLGCSSTGATSGYALDANYGVRQNFAQNGGGIRCVGGEFRVASGDISYNHGQYQGGAVFFSKSQKCFVSGGSISGNKANAGAGIYSTTEDGTTTTIVTVTGGSFKSNQANLSGGALYLTYNATGKVSGSDTEFVGNSANVTNTATSGGALRGGGFAYVPSGTQLEVSGGTFTGNSASGSYGVGGAVLNEGGVFTMTGGTIGGSAAAYANTASGTGGRGGAIYQGGTFNVSGSAVIYAGSERVNDVYLAANSTNVKTITIDKEYKGSGNTTTNKMSVTPANWKRGMAILGGSKLTDGSAGNCNYFAVTDSEWSVLSDSTNKGKLDADLWVSEAVISGVTGAVAGDDTNGRGTKAKPYATIQKAASQTWKTGEATINVSGTLKATGTSNLQNIPASGVTATSINLAGTNSATINANSQGSALTVNGNVVTITNITLTGGKGTKPSSTTNPCGGGIYLTAGTVKLGDGAKITGNTVTGSGGGVYVASGASLFMYGNALIGDSATSTTLPTTTGTSPSYGNKASSGGGIYNDGGSVYIGYDAVGSEKTVTSTTTAWYGVRRNVATSMGAGILHNSGTLLIKSGDISYNLVDSTAITASGGAIVFNADATISGGTFTGNKAKNGGALAVDTGVEVTVNGAAQFTKNAATTSGGAVYNYGTLTMSAGTIGAASALNTATTSGGAIYQKGTFNMSGAAVVYAGTGVSEKNNDVYLAPNGTVVYPITVNATLNSGSSAKITPANWKRGMAVLDGGSLNTTNAGYFAVTDSEWSVLADSTNKGKIESAKIYVAGATGAAEGIGTPSSSGYGTRAKPFDSIEHAAAVCWRSAPYTICVSGELKGAQQKIPSTVTASNASAITLTGLTGTNFDSINRNLTSESSTGNALVIGTAVPVTIEYLKITGGYTSTSGGGVLLSNSSGSLTIGTGALITKNTAKSFGGGIYAEGGLVMTAGEISNNTANLGGGISNKLTLSISGGEISSNKAVTTGGTAPSGGGIYLYGPTSSQISGGMAKPEISGALTMTGNSAEGGSGGAITVPNGYVLLMSGAANLKKNSAAKGGAISLGGVFNMTAGTIGGTTETDSAKADYKNTSSSAIGGAINVTSVGKLRIGGNACVCYGGAIGTNDVYVESTSNVEITSSLSKHTSSTKRIGLTLKNQSVGSTILFGDGLSAAQTCKFLVKKTGNYYIDNKGLLQQGISVTSVTSAAVTSAFDSAGGDKVVIRADISSTAPNIALALKNTTASYAKLDLSQITASISSSNTKSLFKDCTKLKEVSLDLNTFTLSGGSSDATFSGCSSLETINVFGNAGSNWLSTAFYSTSNIKTINFVNATEISYSGREYLPSQYYTKNVTINLPSTLTKFILTATDTGYYTSYITIKYPGSFADFKSNVTISKGVTNRDYGSVTFTFTSGTPTTATWKSAAAGTAGGSWQ